MNLAAPNYYTPPMFVDRFKAASIWNDSGDGKVALDKGGYPQNLDGSVARYGRKTIQTMLNIEPGHYILETDGDIDCELQGGVKVGSKHGRTEFIYDGRIGSSVLLFVFGIRRPPSRMSFVKREELTSFENGDVLIPSVSAALRGLSPIRFMDWTNTNGSQVTDEMPSHETDFCYANGVPLEVCVKLCKQTGAQAYVNIPIMASDLLIRQICAILPPGTIVELSNEVWNSGFAQARYAHEQALKHWGAGGDAGRWYGYRSGQIALMARGSGLQMAIGCQTVIPAAASAIWQGVMESGATSRDFTHWIIATYVNGDLTQGGMNAVEMARNNDVVRAIENILTGPGMSVASQAPVWRQHGDIARARGLQLTAYEGNMHLNALPGWGGNMQLGTKFFAELTRDQRSKRVMQGIVDSFAAAGGKSLCFYNLSQPFTEGGCFGLIGTPSWEVVQRIAR